MRLFFSVRLGILRTNRVFQRFVIVTFKRPPLETFAECASRLANHLRLRLSPEVIIALGMRAKLPGERMLGEDVELIATHQSGDEMTPYERLLGDALRGDPSLFAQERLLLRRKGKSSVTRWGT